MNRLIVQPRPKRPSIAALLVLELVQLSASACSSNPDRGPGADSTSDGAVIEPLWTSSTAWRVAGQPSVVVGAADGRAEYALADVRAATALSDGRIVIADNSTKQIKFYSSTGEYIASFGRDGSGPGEYEFLAAMARTPSDTLLVADGFLRRITVLDARGAYVRSFELPGVGHIAALASVDDGHALVLPALSVDTRTRPDGMVQDTVDVLLLDLVTEVLRPVAKATEAQWIVKKHGGDQASGRLAPFPTPSYVAAGGQRFVIAASADDDARVYSADGAEMAKLEQVRAMPAVGTTEVRAYYDAWYPSGDADLRLRRTGYKDLAPPRMPAFDGLVVDSRGNVWVRRYFPPWKKKRSSWDVHRADGRWLGTVELPVDRHVDWRTKDLLEVGRNYVLLLLTDTIGVQRIGRFELARDVPSS